MSFPLFFQSFQHTCSLEYGGLTAALQISNLRVQLPIKSGAEADVAVRARTSIAEAQAEHTRTGTIVPAASGNRQTLALRICIDGLLFVLLDCGSLDISILDDVGYDLGDIAVELQEEGVNVTLNNITDAIFRKGQDELKGTSDL